MASHDVRGSEDPSASVIYPILEAGDSALNAGECGCEGRGTLPLEERIEGPEVASILDGQTQLQGTSFTRSHSKSVLAPLVVADMISISNPGVPAQLDPSFYLIRFH